MRAFDWRSPNGATSKGTAVAVLVASRARNNQPEPLGGDPKICAPGVSDIAKRGQGAVAKLALTGFATLNGMGKFELTPPRGQQQRFGIALITRLQMVVYPTITAPAFVLIGILMLH